MLRAYQHHQVYHSKLLNFENPEISTFIVEDAIEHNSKTTLHLHVLNRCSPRICMNISKTKSKSIFLYGDTLSAKVNFVELKKAEYRFFSNFNNYLIGNHIYYSAELRDSIYEHHKFSGSSIIHYSQNLAETCKGIFSKSIHDKATANLLVALLLGDKSGLDNKVKNDFITTGTAHILAVSGLHLGMIYTLLQSLLNLVFKQKKHNPKNIFKSGLILAAIWLFACISGLGASVVRAAVMLSTLELSTCVKRKADQVNSLFACAFFMLFYNPCTLYDIGFQLSITAVLSIVLFNPFLTLLYRPSWTVLQKTWELLSVSFSVQLLVSPVSVYYFQQFPVYFILSNIVWIPLSFILMLVGIAMIPAYYLSDSITQLLAHVCTPLSTPGLAVFKLIERLPVRNLTGLWIYSEQVYFYITALLFIFFWMKYKRNRLLFSALLLFLTVPLVNVLRMVSMNHFSELIVYKEIKKIQLDLRIGDRILSTHLNSDLMYKFREARQVKLYENITDFNQLYNLLADYNIDVAFCNDCGNQSNDSTFFELPSEIVIQQRSINLINEIHVISLKCTDVKSICSNYAIPPNSNEILHCLDTDAPFIIKL